MADVRRASADEQSSLPMRLAEHHWRLQPGDWIELDLPSAAVMADRLADIVHGAGFTAVTGEPGCTRLQRVWTLPDTVGAGMRVLVVGLNPSPAAADAGVGFARPGNRFWPAAVAAGLVTRDRDPVHALVAHGLGMTDLVKRTTRRADELDPAEFRAGLARVERLVDWLAPQTVCVVGLAGWRTARDRRAVAGWQSGRLGGARLYLMPSTSGLNASSRLEDLVAHLAEVAGS